MLEKAFDVYIRGFHPGNLKKLMENFWTTYSLIYMLLIMPSISFKKIVFASVGNALFYYGFALLLFVALSHNELVPLVLPKQMFLCPMQEETRKEYMKALLTVKIVVPFIIMVLPLTGVAIAFHKDLCALANLLFGMLSLIITVLMNPGGGKERDIRQTGKFAWMEKTGQLVNMLAAGCHVVFSLLALLKEEPIDGGLAVYFAISVAVQLLLNIGVIRWNVPIIVEGAMDYETCMRLLENVNKNGNREK